MNAMSNVTNEERREVARKLRKLASENQGAIGSMRKMQEVLTQAKKITGTMNLPSVAHVLERYADLIDRPTCKTIEHEGTDEFHVCKSCSRCSYGWFEDIYDKPYSYCPNCGAEVIDE